MNRDNWADQRKKDPPGKPEDREQEKRKDPNETNNHPIEEPKPDRLI